MLDIGKLCLGLVIDGIGVLDHRSKLFQLGLHRFSLY